MTELVKELQKFIQLGARLDLKLIALDNILGLTGSEEGSEMMLNNANILVSLIALLEDSNILAGKAAALILINLSANEKGAESLLNLQMELHCPPLQKPPDNLIKTAIKFVKMENSEISDACAMILSNLSRNSPNIEEFESNISYLEIINILCLNTNKMHYLATVLSNLSRFTNVRKKILNETFLNKSLAFISFDEIIRRGGIIGMIKNCCFEMDFHDFLLEEINLLPYLLLPLAGNEEFDDEDNEKLPVELQYLEESKQREPDADIRKMLLEALHQLCTKRKNREFIRNKNSYIILRELHKWETDKQVLVACENLVDILIRTENEIGEDNLKEIDIPADLTEEFHKIDLN